MARWPRSKTAEEALSELDAWTKQGRRLAVLRELEQAVRAKPDPSYLPKLARLANRNHAYLLALRILHPAIRDDRERIAQASPESLTIYATSLLWIGALEEAEAHLERATGLVESLLVRAFVCFAKWDYESSVPLIERYLASREITPYQRLVGQVNLLAALIAIGDAGRARAVLATLKPELARDASTRILHGNCLELEAQLELQSRRNEQAGACLAESERALADQPGRYLLYVRKWKAILGLTLDPSSAEARRGLLEVKAEALELRNWETIRDCDFHLARLTGQKELLDRVLLGTPYRAYHERIAQLFGATRPPDRRLVYCPGEIDREPGRIGLDLEAMGWGALHNPTAWPLIQLMTKDIYRPPRVGVVFSALYPGEYFDPFTSPQRVRNSVFRFNEWAKQERLEFRVVNRRGDYFLEGPQGLAVASVARAKPKEAWEAALSLMSKKAGGRSFSAADLARELGVTSRTAVSLLAQALLRRRVERIGKGRATRYILSSGRRARRGRAA